MTYVEDGKSATSKWVIYVNKIPVYSTNEGYYPNDSSGGCKLGKTNYAHNNPSQLYLDEFRVYNRVLTQTDVNALYIQV